MTTFLNVHGTRPHLIDEWRVYREHGQAYAQESRMLRSARESAMALNGLSDWVADIYELDILPGDMKFLRLITSRVA